MCCKQLYQNTNLAHARLDRGNCDTNAAIYARGHCATDVLPLHYVLRIALHDPTILSNIQHYYYS